MFGCDHKQQVTPTYISQPSLKKPDITIPSDIKPVPVPPEIESIKTIDIEPVINSYNESVTQFGGALHVIRDEYQKLFDVFNLDGVRPDIHEWFIYLRNKLGTMPNFDFEPTLLRLDNYKVPVSQEVVDLVQEIHNTIIVVHDALVALEKISIRDIDLYKLYEEA
jgi:hypothetical protein